MTKPFQGHDQRRHPRLGARLGAVRAAAGTEGAPNVVYIVLDDVGLLGDGLLRRPDRDAEHRSDRRRWRAVHAVAHDGVVLADALVPADRPQPHAQQHGVHHRGGDRLPERQRHDPAGERQIQEILGERGWNTYMVGKWHLCPTTR